MKQERLLGILVYLSRKRNTTAPELAEQFEVSRRTINRDLESLCQGGVPLITAQGKGGGIFLPEGYVLEESLFPADEIDLHSFYSESIISKTALIRQAIDREEDIRFTYYSEKGPSKKRIFPVRILYKWSDWYVKGWCRERKEYRLYKFNRLWELSIVPEKGSVPPPCPPEEKDIFPANYRLKALFGEEATCRLVEEYGPVSINNHHEGRILFESSFTNYAYMLRWILSFGETAEVLEPEELREELKATAASLKDIYS